MNRIVFQAANAMISCPKCTESNDASQDFCDKCGEALTMDGVQEDYFGGSHYMAMD
jgi:rRNA maturation endonuclease Nob1